MSFKDLKGRWFGQGQARGKGCNPDTGQEYEWKIVPQAGVWWRWLGTREWRRGLGPDAELIYTARGGKNS